VALMADQYLFDLTVGGYIDPAGRPVPVTAINAAASEVQSRARDEMAALTKRLVDGDLTPARWERQASAMLREAHLTATALAVGGWAQVPAFEDDLVDRLTGEFTYLAGFRTALPDLTEGQIAARADLYASNVWATYQQMRGALAEQTGMDEERNVTDPAAESCAECDDLEADDWVPLDTLPEVGERACLARCRCTIEYRAAGVEEKRVLVGAGVARAYNPDEPRLPAGGPGGGEWTSDGGSDTGAPDSLATLASALSPASAESWLQRDAHGGLRPVDVGALATTRESRGFIGTSGAGYEITSQAVHNQIGQELAAAHGYHGIESPMTTVLEAGHLIRYVSLPKQHELGVELHAPPSDSQWSTLRRFATSLPDARFLFDVYPPKGAPDYAARFGIGEGFGKLRAAAERAYGPVNGAARGLFRAWDEAQHPREPAGTSAGGEFAGGEGGGLPATAPATGERDMAASRYIEAAVPVGDVEDDTQTGIVRYAVAQELASDVYAAVGAKGAFSDLADATKWVDDQIRTWEGSSRATRILGLHEAVRQKFDLPESTMRGVADLPLTPSPEQRALVDAIYRNTQAHLAALGIKELTLVRGGLVQDALLPPGIRHGGQGDHVDGTAQLAPLNSWTSQPHWAERFANAHGLAQAPQAGQQRTAVVLQARVPAARIFSTGRTGLGALVAHEYVVLGGPTPTRFHAEELSGGFQYRAARATGLVPVDADPESLDWLRWAVAYQVAQERAFNPDQPRDDQGRWTTSDDNSRVSDLAPPGEPPPHTVSNDELRGLIDCVSGEYADIRQQAERDDTDASAREYQRLGDYLHALYAEANRRDLFKAYNPDQPRDEHGRWTDSGGTVVPTREPSQDAAVEAALFAGASTSSTELEKIAAAAIAARIEANPAHDSAAFDAIFQSPYDYVRSVEHAWQLDAQSVTSMRFAEAVAHALDLPPAAVSAMGNRADAGRNAVPMMEVARATYAETQAQLAAAGLPSVVLYRGVNHYHDELPAGLKPGVSDSHADVSFTARPLTSWSSDPTAAELFALRQRSSDRTGYVLSARVPASRIFSTGRSGFGERIEREFLVLGGSMKARAHTARTAGGQIDVTRAAPREPVLNIDADRENADWLRWVARVRQAAPRAFNPVELEWDPAQHPRIPAGQPGAGEFIGGTASAPEDPAARAWYQRGHEGLPTQPEVNRLAREVSRGLRAQVPTGPKPLDLMNIWHSGARSAKYRDLRSAVQQEFHLPGDWATHRDPAQYKPLVRAIYAATQNQLAAAGIKDVTLYRGLLLGNDTLPPGVGPGRSGGHADTVHQGRPLASWTSNPAIPPGFAKTHHKDGMTAVILQATFPASKVFSTAHTGIGLLRKEEFVILGGPQHVRLHTQDARGRWDLYKSLMDHSADVENDAWLHEDDPEPLLVEDPDGTVHPVATPAELAAALAGMGLTLAEFLQTPAAAAMPASLRPAPGKAVKYSPDQPRDEHGRFATGSSGDGEATKPKHDPPVIGAGRDATTRPDPEYDRLHADLLRHTSGHRMDGARIATTQWLEKQRAAAGIPDKGQKVALWGLAWNQLPSVAVALARFYQQYPLVAADLKTVDILPNRQFQGGTKQVVAHAWPDGPVSHLEGNGLRMAQVDDHSRVRNGWFPEGTDKVQGILWHELGHVLNHHLDRVMATRPFNDRAAEDWRDFQKHEMSSDRLSQYSVSKTDPKAKWREGFAESFAQYNLASTDKWTAPTFKLAALLEHSWVAPLVGHRSKSVGWFFTREWDEAQHPREPAGSPQGGEFAGGAEAAAALLAQRKPDPSALRETIAAADAAAAAAAALNGQSVDDYKASVEANLRRLYDEAEIHILLRADRVGKLLSDGELKTAFEVSRLRKQDENYMASRSQIEQTMFGLPADTPVDNRPIYGSLATPGVGPDIIEHDSYGGTTLELKPAVKDRATALWGDSFERKQATADGQSWYAASPAPVYDPKWYSVGTYARIPDVGAAADPARLDTVSNMKGAAYIETQIHGDAAHPAVSVSDIARVVFDKPPSASAVRALDKLGIAHASYQFEAEPYPPHTGRPAAQEFGRLRDAYAYHGRELTMLAKFGEHYEHWTGDPKWKEKSMKWRDDMRRWQGVTEASFAKWGEPL
jgi:hypothetical protein